MLYSKKICVLIDDDEDDQMIFRTVINMNYSNYHLEAFSNFENAKSYILENPNCIDALFIDLNMPKFNGIDCLNFLRQQAKYEEKHIIIYTTSNNPDDAKRCLRHGATDFMTKPSSVKDLVSELSKYLIKEFV